MTEQVAWNKSSLLLKNILQNTQILQLSKIKIKTENIYNSYKNDNFVAWAEEPRGFIKMRG